MLGRFEQETRNRLTERENEERVVIVFQIGINDCALENGKEQVSIDAFKNNCIKLVKFAQRITDCIYFVSLAHVDESKSMCLPWTSHVYKNENITGYNSALQNLCSEYEVGFIDVALEWSKADYPKLLEDGLHPNAEGHELIFNIVRKMLEDDGII